LMNAIWGNFLESKTENNLFGIRQKRYGYDHPEACKHYVLLCFEDKSVNWQVEWFLSLSPAPHRYAKSSTDTLLSLFVHNRAGSGHENTIFRPGPGGS